MVCKETLVYVADNSGARRGQVIFVYKTKLRGILLGRQLLLTLKRIVPNNLKKLKKGDKVKAVLVTSSSWLKQNNIGYEAKNKLNKFVVLKKNEITLPLGTRVTIKVSKFLRYLGYIRLCLISKGLY
jgi:ribosomal protein L14